MKTAAIIALSVLLAGSIALHFLKEDPVVSVDPGKEERDSLQAVIRDFEKEQAHWGHTKDSLIASLDSVLKYRPTMDEVRERNTVYLNGASADTLRAILLRKYIPKRR